MRHAHGIFSWRGLFVNADNEGDRMKRKGKVIVGIFGAFVALIVIAIVVIATYDWNRLKPMINDKVSQAIGRPFVIQGNLGVTWRREPDAGWLASIVPWPELEARDIRVANPQWASQPQFAQLDALRFRVAPLPLIAHRIKVPMLQLDHPVLTLERDKDGRATWDFTFPQDSEPSPWKLELGSIGFSQGQASLSDVQNQLTLDVKVDPLEKAIPFDQIVAQQSDDARDQAAKTTGAAAKKTLAASGEKDDDKGPRPRLPYQFAWQAEGKYHGAPVKGSGKTGGVLALQDTNTPFPVQADIHVQDTHIAFVGTLTDPMHMGALNLKLWFSGRSMAKLYPLTGITLPDTPPYATEGRLTAQLRPQGSHFEYKHFRGRVGGSDLAGDLTFDTGGARPKLAGTLRSQLLQFSDLAPLIGADSNADKQERGDAVMQPADKALPVEPFRTDRWKAMDADVQFTGARIVRDADLPIDKLSTHIILDNGVLKLTPLNFGMAGGTVVSNIMLDGSTTPMKGKLDLHARQLKLKQLFPKFEVMKTSFGEINGSTNLSAQGNSVAALLGTADGELKLLMNDGAVSKALLETAGLNVANIIIARLFGDKVVKINCAAADLGATNGLFSTRMFVMDTEDAIIVVNGTVNFANEKLDLKVKPSSKGLRIISLRSPLYVKGTLKNPDVGVEAGPLILRGGGAVALAVFAAPAAALIPLIATGKEENDNTCREVLTQMKGTAEVKR